MHGDGSEKIITIKMQMFFICAVSFNIIITMQVANTALAESLSSLIKAKLLSSFGRPLGRNCIVFVYIATNKLYYFINRTASKQLWPRTAASFMQIIIRSSDVHEALYVLHHMTVSYDYAFSQLFSVSLDFSYDMYLVNIYTWIT